MLNSILAYVTFNQSTFKKQDFFCLVRCFTIGNVLDRQRCDLK